MFGKVDEPLAPVVTRADKTGDPTKEIESLHATLLRSDELALRDWDVDSFQLRSPEDSASLTRHADRLATMLDLRLPRTFDIEVHLGCQSTTPQYDRRWATGTGWPLADLDGGMFIVASDGFSSSGFGFFLTAQSDALVGIRPVGPLKGSWANLEQGSRARSKAGVGVVIYDGNSLMVSRQPILWDVNAPPRYTGQNFEMEFADVATPAAPWSFGPVPLGTTLIDVSAGRTYLIWYYLWHLGSGLADKPFLGMLSATVPMVSICSGPEPIVH